MYWTPLHSPEIEAAEVEVEGAEEGHDGEDVPLAKHLVAAAEHLGGERQDHTGLQWSAEQNSHLNPYSTVV